MDRDPFSFKGDFIFCSFKAVRFRSGGHEFRNVIVNVKQCQARRDMSLFEAAIRLLSMKR